MLVAKSSAAALSKVAKPSGHCIVMMRGALAAIQTHKEIILVEIMSLRLMINILMMILYITLILIFQSQNLTRVLWN